MEPFLIASANSILSCSASLESDSVRMSTLADLKISYAPHAIDCAGF
jgi:hypothetical protein